jgi:hypothetical protein
MITLVRVAAVLLALLMLSGRILDLAGVLPRSGDEPPALGPRSVLIGVAAIVLLIPYRFVRREPLRIIVGIAVILVALATLAMGAQGIYGYLRSAKSWHIVPVTLIFCAITAGNAVAFRRITRS